MFCFGNNVANAGSKKGGRADSGFTLLIRIIPWKGHVQPYCLYNKALNIYEKFEDTKVVHRSNRSKYRELSGKKGTKEQ
jgi:hypothetical protein